MTVDELIDEAAKLNGWHFRPSSGMIRRRNDHGDLECPITAVYNARHNDRLRTSQFSEAGRALGLSTDDALTLADAADDIIGMDQDIRAKLLKLL